MAWANPENSVQGGIFHREAYEPPSISNWTLLQLPLKGGPYQYF